MAFLENPIDIEEYVRIYRRENEFSPDKKLVAFTQTKAGKYTATWQNDDFQSVLFGRVEKLRAWLEEHAPAEEQPPSCVPAEILQTEIARVQYLVNAMDADGHLEDGCFTFPDGETVWAAGKDPHTATPLG